MGAWAAATLDELVRELEDIIICVSAGNRDQPRSGEQIEQAVSNYPHSMMENDNRLLERAFAMVLTLGPLARDEGLDSDRAGGCSAEADDEALQRAQHADIGRSVLERALTASRHEVGIHEPLEVMTQGRRRHVDVALDVARARAFAAGLHDEAQNRQTNRMAERAELLGTSFKLRDHNSLPTLSKYGGNRVYQRRA